MQATGRQLLSHLSALRKVLLISAAAIAVAFVLLFYLYRMPLVDFLLRPLRAREIEAVATHVSEALMTQFKACLVAALVASMPVLLWQVWGFVAPALYPAEKRVFLLLFLAALLLFGFGVAFSYLFVFPLAIDLFFEAGQGMVATLWSVDKYFDFVLSFVLPFGLMFQLPVALYMLARRGLITYPKLARSRRFVILGISILAAILTPPDMVSQVMLGLPMYLLFEGAAQLVRFVKPVKEQAEIHKHTEGTS